MKKSPLLLFIFLLFSCSRDAKRNNEQVEDVRNTLKNYYEAVAHSGLLAEFAYLDSSRDFFWVPPGFQGPVGYDSIARIIRQNAGALRSVQSVFDTLSVFTLSERFAGYSGRLHSVVTDTGGRRTEMRLVETGTLIKRQDGWKLYCGQTSMLAP